MVYDGTNRRAMRKRLFARLILIPLSAMLATPLLAGSESRPAQAPGTLPSGCTSEQAVTAPAPVNMGQVVLDAYNLEDAQGKRIFRGPHRSMEQEMTHLFDLSVPRSKLEQFYTMLFYTSRYASHPGDEITLDVASARNLLLSSKVFSDPEFPRQITRIHLTRKNPARPCYQVAFDTPEVWLPLNKGAGFGVVRQGMCQHAKSLVFYGGFSFCLAMQDGNLEVSDFENVDLWGTFGSRGFINLDINYVSVKSVEFLKGNALGLVKAKVSRKEFEVNQHFFLIELITKFVTDKSIQPIDW
jgi:hypothetical protein